MRGIGIANYVEITSGAPRERTEITVLPEGRVELVMGTMSSGQGHETSFAQLVTEWLGVPFESIDYVAHDTDRVAAGGGSHSGRSMKLATTIIGKATDDIIDKGRKIAGFLFETSEADIEFAAGRFRVAGTDREIGIFEVAGRRHAQGPAGGFAGPLAAISDQTLPVASFPYGTQVCEVEVDPETGAVEIVGYAAVDDVGRAINPLILHGQTHGGIAQGVGQALLENRATTTRRPGSCWRRASWITRCRAPTPSRRWTTALSEVPSPTNRLGVRSGGEGGTTPALGVVINAIVDALSELGVRHVEMPATPERVWRAIREAEGAQMSACIPTGFATAHGLIATST